MNDKIMFGEKEITLSLTSKNSHKVVTEPGQGSFSIGAKSNFSKKYDAEIDEDSIINWEAFDGYYTLARWQEKNKYPYGDWPRFFYYNGNDTGFIKWSTKRKIEDFSWSPQKDMIVDFKNSNIYSLELYVKSNQINLSLGDKIKNLHLHGPLENFKIKKCGQVPMLWFYPEFEKDIVSYNLPSFKVLKNATEVNVSVSPLSAPFDCSSLLQFPNLKSLYLIGNLANLNSLKELKKIEKIGFWDAPNLQGLPKLNEWSNLKSIIAVNIEEKTGKLLKKELNELKKVKTLDYSTIEKLRTPLWFETNYGIPFSNWEEENEKKATRAYKVCLKNIKKSKTEEEIKNEIVVFIKKINRLKNIETTEGDDVYTALQIFMKNSPIIIDSEKWELWFDETRDF